MNSTGNIQPVMVGTGLAAAIAASGKFSAQMTFTPADNNRVYLFAQKSGTSKEFGVGRVNEDGNNAHNQIELYAVRPYWKRVYSSIRVFSGDWSAITLSMAAGTYPFYFTVHNGANPNSISSSVSNRVEASNTSALAFAADATSVIGCDYYDTSMPDLEGKRISNLQAVGLQPFGRPGKQAGYVLRMRPEENMNRMAGFEKIKFRHVADINELIFNYSNQSLNYFPEEIFKSKLLKIRSEEHLFSRNALKLARGLYFKDLSDDVIIGFLRDKNIELSDTDLYSFSTHEKNLALNYWRTHEREYLDKIIIREVIGKDGTN